MADLFKEILPSIMRTKNNVLDNEKDYVPYIINRALSFHYDCVVQANQMNLFPNLPSTLQYQFLLNTVRGYKRPFEPWQKRETIENLEAVKEYFNYSNQKAKEAMVLLSDADMEEIKRRIHKGGTNDSKPRRFRGD